MRNYAFAAGCAAMGVFRHNESQLDRIVTRLRNAARWLIDTLKQPGVPSDIHHRR